MRGARLETVRAHPFGSPSYTPQTSLELHSVHRHGSPPVARRTDLPGSVARRVSPLSFVASQVPPCSSLFLHLERRPFEGQSLQAQAEELLVHNVGKHLKAPLIRMQLVCPVGTIVLLKSRLRLECARKSEVVNPTREHAFNVP